MELNINKSNVGQISESGINIQRDVTIGEAKKSWLSGLWQWICSKIKALWTGK